MKFKYLIFIKLRIKNFLTDIIDIYLVIQYILDKQFKRL